MTRFFNLRISVAGIVLEMGMCVLISCQPSASTTGAKSAAQAEFRQTNGPVRDLSRDESAGGHILRKHVGQTDEQLRERLEREPRITGASTYTDRSTAEHTVGVAIAQSQEKIQRWLKRSGGHPNLVMDYDSETPIGRTINRGESQSHSCSHALVVLKYAGPNDYYVLTSYPECR
jgi:toxin YxiD